MMMNTDLMKTAADQAVDLLKSLSNRHRLMIMCQLVNGEQSVGQLAQFLGIRDSTVSQHLALMRREKIISARRSGQVIWYSIESAEARKLIETLYQSFCPVEPNAG